MSLKTFLYIYFFGGVTFIPLVLGLLFLYAYHTIPYHDDTKRQQNTNDGPSRLARDDDEKIVLKTNTDNLAEKFLRKHENDVAAGYFAVCREYVPGGINGKPPERLNPAGEEIKGESPSVYQTMYRSIFDRVHKGPSIAGGEGGVRDGQPVRRNLNNVFYVVLRHGHLMLYDDIQQLEVRYVISLEYHDVDIYGGTDDEVIPESEIWIKRNALRLRRKKVQIGDRSPSLPFFFFSENQSEKEDFYFAILNNMQKSLGDNPPVPQEFDTAHIITLVQRLHSSEEQLQTRWLNALLGRVFLGIYKTPELEAHIRQKLTKKIGRVTKPDFITKLALQKIETGTGAPFFTNPRLKDLTVNGDCTVEADVEYSGNFRIEIAATVRIDLGKRLGAREVDIVLAATVKKLQGHILGKLKPPPSNRMWVSFEKVPKMEMKLEPIVSSRQITYTFILRQIESRIMEVIAETIVLPFWDDVPFTHTEGEAYRGGIWKKLPQQNQSTEIKDEDVEDEAESATGTSIPNPGLNKEERNMSMPVLTDPDQSAKAAAKKSVASLKETLGSSDGSRTPDRKAPPPRILRSSSFAAAANPMVSPSHAPAEASAIDIQATSKRDSMLKDLSARSLGTSPESEVRSHSPPKDSSRPEQERNRTNSTASNVSSGSIKSSRKTPRRDTVESDTTLVGSIESGQTATQGSLASDSASTHSKRSSVNGENQSKIASAARNFASNTADNHPKAIANIVAARDAAQKWGWGVIARNKREAEARASGSESESTSRIDTSQPMGRGQPLPPPGQPLPKPAQPAGRGIGVANMFSLPKRKAVPAQAQPQPSPNMSTTSLPRKDSSGSISLSNNGNSQVEVNVSSTTLASDSGTDPVAKRPHSNSPPKQEPQLPALPARNRRQSYLQMQTQSQHDQDDLLVVEAPKDSTPNTPLPAENDEHHDDFFGHGEDAGTRSEKASGQ